MSKSVTVSMRRGLSLLSGRGPSLDKRVLEGLQVRPVYICLTPISPPFHAHFTSDLRPINAFLTLSLRLFKAHLFL